MRNETHLLGTSTRQQIISLMPPILSRRRSGRKTSINLENGSRIGVIGGGPSGSFFSYFLLEMAERAGLDLQVDIYEPRDFSLPAPKGCNMCAGVISETLVQNLATEGINLPASVVQKAIDSYVLHTDLGNQRIDAARHEKRIGAMFRGAGPRGIPETRFHGFDAHLLSLATERGAHRIPFRVTAVERTEKGHKVVTNKNTAQDYDLLVVAAGVNSAALKLFEQGPTNYHPPQTTKTAIREYFFSKEIIEKTFGNALHVFLLDIPNLDFAMIIPKGEVVSVCMLGKDINEDLIRAFLTAPEVQTCFPDGWRWDQPDCHCMPRINVRPGFQPYGERLVFIGDSGVTRLYKDGIGAAYRAAKAAAACAVLQGISAEDFRRYYAPFCRSIAVDNRYGRLIFFITHLIQRVGFARRAMLQMVAAEQAQPEAPKWMSSVLWDAFTGSAPYSDVFLRTLHPAFTSRYLRSLIGSLVGRDPSQTRSRTWNQVN